MAGEQLWQRFVQLLEQLPKLQGAAIVAEDRALATAITAAPGVLEAQLVARIDELAAHACPRAPSLLGYFWEMFPPGHQILATHPGMFHCLATTFAVLDAPHMMRFYAASRQRLSSLGKPAEQNGVYLASYFLARAGVAILDGLPLIPEHRDCLISQVQQTPLPDVLPVDLTAWTPHQISDALATYAGRSRAELEQHLRQRQFLAPSEALGDVIHCDAVALARLGISRHELATRLQRVLDIARHNQTRATLSAPSRASQRLLEQLGPPGADGRYEQSFTCGFAILAGHMSDPFHSSIVSTGASPFEIANPKRDRDSSVSGHEVVLSLIRRYGFFAGATTYRTDPMRAAWVLGLTDTPPPALGSQPLAAPQLGEAPPIKAPPLPTSDPRASTSPAQASWWRRLAARITSR